MDVFFDGVGQRVIPDLHIYAYTASKAFVSTVTNITKGAVA